MDKKNADELLKKIEAKIKELEAKETPNDLLRNALLKKNIISNVNDVSDDQIDKLFNIIDREVNS